LPPVEWDLVQIWFTIVQMAQANHASLHACSGDVLLNKLACKDNHFVLQLRQELAQTHVMLEGKRSQLTAKQQKLQTALEKRVSQESCLRQHEQEVLDMKLKLALCRQRMQHPIEEVVDKDNKYNNDSLSVNAKLEVYNELLQQKEEELNKCEEYLLKLEATEKDLCTQMSEHQKQLRLCRVQQCSSNMQQRHKAQSTVMEDHNAACQVQAQLKIVNAANSDPQEHQTVAEKDSLHTEECATRTSSTGVVPRSPSFQIRVLQCPPRVQTPVVSQSPRVESPHVQLLGVPIGIVPQSPSAQISVLQCSSSVQAPVVHRFPSAPPCVMPESPCNDQARALHQSFSVRQQLQEHLSMLETGQCRTQELSQHTSDSLSAILVRPTEQMQPRLSRRTLLDRGAERHTLSHSMGSRLLDLSSKTQHRSPEAVYRRVPSQFCRKSM